MELKLNLFSRSLYSRNKLYFIPWRNSLWKMKVAEESVPMLFGAKIWLGYLSADIICSEKRIVFRERGSRKTVRFSEQIMSKENIRTYFRPHWTDWRLLCLLSFKSFSKHVQFFVVVVVIIIIIIIICFYVYFVYFLLFLFFCCANISFSFHICHL